MNPPLSRPLVVVTLLSFWFAPPIRAAEAEIDIVRTNYEGRLVPIALKASPARCARR